MERTDEEILADVMSKIPPVFSFASAEGDDPVSKTKRAANEEHFRRHVALVREKETDPSIQERFMAELRQRQCDDLIDGFFEGWWDLDENGQRLAPAQKFKMSDFPSNALMAHVIAAAGIFPSVSQARKNGWDTPLVPGEFLVTKKKIRIVVLDQ
ncbi:MAG: hypothetical protein HC836_23310 [Richelia sp. RM2_1_2]|nr:hypothetical protein [Richelia sp. RM2_1_2]